MTYEVGDNVYFGKWAAAVWALPGSLRNLYQKTGPVAALTAMSKINTNISDYMFKLAKDADPDEILGMKTEISEHVAEMFGGEDVATDFEKSIGLNVGNPWLFDLNFGKRSMEAKEKLYEAEMFHKSLQQIEEDVKDPDKRANTMLAVNGMLQKNVIDLEGSTDALTGGLLSLFTKKK
jgi:hypothetical protein